MPLLNNLHKLLRFIIVHLFIKTCQRQDYRPVTFYYDCMRLIVLCLSVCLVVLLALAIPGSALAQTATPTPVPTPTPAPVGYRDTLPDGSVFEVQPVATFGDLGIALGVFAGAAINLVTVLILTLRLRGRGSQ
jgi:hypothetical protein